jgi:hypothetical protein
MAEIVSFAKFKEENSPHWEGPTKCVSCGHKWHQVAPIGTWWVECPSCGLERGHPYHPFGPRAGETVFQCNCGSEALTAYYRNGVFRTQCMSCGVDHTHAIFGEAP